MHLIKVVKGVIGQKAMSFREEEAYNLRLGQLPPLRSNKAASLKHSVHDAGEAFPTNPGSELTVITQDSTVFEEVTVSQHGRCTHEASAKCGPNCSKKVNTSSFTVLN